MASKIEFSSRARRNLILIKDYIAQDDPTAAETVLLRIAKSIRSLAAFPELGAVWQNTGTRALVIHDLPNRVHYQIAGNTVEIITVVHTSKRFPLLND